MPAIFADTAMLPQGWAHDVRIDIDGGGTIVAVRQQHAATATDGTERVAALIPGMPNVHCHAFQRAMAGLTERAGPEQDDFWSWREVMYGFLAELSPDQVEAIAAQLYVEMLKNGYTAVAEFHYLHRDPNGTPYANRAEMAERIVAAAKKTSIRVTLLPVLYQTSKFGGESPTTGQRRFVNTWEDFLALLEQLLEKHGADHNIKLGIAPHSLRAVAADALKQAFAFAELRKLPLHIHVAEQMREVEDCLAWSGQRPVEWLLEHGAIDSRCTLIHCTHMSDAETRALAKSGAVAGLCPTTEADLGDGIFPLIDYLGAGGAFGIGSDSNVGTAPAEELRWLEYGHRLMRRRRNLVSATPGDSTGARLWRAALAGGAQALAQPVGAIAPGCRADFLVLDPDHPALTGRNNDGLLDSLIFAGGTAAIRHVMVAGRWAIRDGRHRDEVEIAEAFRRAVARLR